MVILVEDKTMEMPQITQAHRKLEKLVGDWEGEEHLFPSPIDPQGGTTRARVHNVLALDGFAVIQDYEQQRGAAVNFRGHGVFAWNSALQCYTLHWFDSMGMPPVVYQGSFDGDVLALSYRSDQGFFRATFDYSRPNQSTFRQEVSPDGQQWFPFLEGSYTKRSKESVRSNE
jgi:hypothetical protein